MTPHFLAGIFTSKDFKEDEQRTIISKFRQVRFTRNDHLLREGKTESHYWFLESGYARAYVTDVNGRDITTCFFTAGDIVIDWPSFFLRSPARECIQALTDCVCWQLDYSAFQELFHSIGSFREQGRTRLVRSYFDLKKHSVSMIADEARDRYLQLLQDKPHIVQHVSLKYIASYLGVTNSSLSRIRKEIR